MYNKAIYGIINYSAQWFSAEKNPQFRSGNSEVKTEVRQSKVN